jgi:voltage-gated potassium channel
VIFVGLIRNFWHLCRTENLHRTTFGVIGLILAGGLAFWLFEPKASLADSLWWAVVTSTTVGYGDLFPTTWGGRVAGVLLMVLGIGFLGILTATLAGLMVENRILASKGLKEVSVSGHYIICGWNLEGSKIIKELAADDKSRNSPIVIIANLPERPYEAEHVSFVQGDVDQETLQKAHAKEACAVLMLSDDNLSAELRDAKLIMDVLTVKNLYPGLHVCAGIVDPKNLEHCRMARADEIIVLGQLGTHLMVQGALDPGIPHLVEELVSNRYGNDLFLVNTPESLVGQSYLSALSSIKQEHGALLLGLSRPDGRMLTNPKGDYEIGRDDKLVIVATSRPNLA